MQVNPLTSRRGLDDDPQDEGSRKKLKTEGAVKSGGGPNKQDENTDPLLSTHSRSNEFDNVANDAVKAAAAAAAVQPPTSASSSNTNNNDSNSTANPSSANKSSENQHQQHQQPPPQPQHHAHQPPPPLDSEMLKEKAAAAAAAANGTGNSDAGLQQILLNHDLPHTNQILQERLNSPLARGFRSQFNNSNEQHVQDAASAAAAAAAAAGAGAGPSSSSAAGSNAPPDSHNNPAGSPDSADGNKPDVGSEQWHKLRRDNHKEVERRRRENINKGIERIAEIVPECEKQKSMILQRAYEYILKLKQSEASNMEKFALEKLLTEQAIAELTNSNNRLRVEIENAWRDVEHWKHVCLNHGIDINKEAPPKRDQISNESSSHNKTSNENSGNNNS